MMISAVFIITGSVVFMVQTVYSNIILTKFSRYTVVDEPQAEDNDANSARFRSGSSDRDSNSELPNTPPLRRGRRGRGRGRGRGGGRGGRSNNLTDRQRKVILEGWKSTRTASLPFSLH